MLEGDHEQDGGGVWFCLVADVSDRDVGYLVVMYRHQPVSQSVSQPVSQSACQSASQSRAVIEAGGCIVDVWTM